MTETQTPRKPAWWFDPTRTLLASIAIAASLQADAMAIGVTTALLIGPLSPMALEGPR